MQSCIDSVRCWADHRGYSYILLDDVFFNYAPTWFHEATNSQRHLVSDYARLEVAAAYLKQEWDAVIWVDADVFICDMRNFEVDTQKEFLLSRELWMTKIKGEIVFSDRVNNSVMMFKKDNEFLDFYIDACKKIVNKKMHNCRHTEIGTNFLSGIPYELPLLQTVACLSPFLLSEFSRDRKESISRYRDKFLFPIYAINLCLTFRGWKYDEMDLTDQVYMAAIDHFKNHGIANNDNCCYE